MHYYTEDSPSSVVRIAVAGPRFEFGNGTYLAAGRQADRIATPRIIHFINKYTVYGPQNRLPQNGLKVHIIVKAQVRTRTSRGFY
jgi:hypothetical protein